MRYKNKKTPEQCLDMNDIRAEIDGMDREIVAMLGQRFNYVKAAAKFKTSATSVRAPERYQAMLAERRVWAESEGLSADVIEQLYRDLVDYFISEEMSQWQSDDSEK